MLDALVTLLNAKTPKAVGYGLGLLALAVLAGWAVARLLEGTPVAGGGS